MTMNLTYLLISFISAQKAKNGQINPKNLSKNQTLTMESKTKIMKNIEASKDLKEKNDMSPLLLHPDIKTATTRSLETIPNPMDYVETKDSETKPSIKHKSILIISNITKLVW